MSNKQVKEIRDYKIIATSKYHKYIDEVADLFKDRKISMFKTAKNIAYKLSAPGKAP